MRNFKMIIIIWGLISLFSSFISDAQDQTQQAIPQVDGDGTLRRIQIPILMYHYISPLPPDADEIRVGLTLDPVIFRQHVQFLAENGYTSISLYEMDNALENGVELPPNPVILTFDDGYSDAYTTVFPILQEFGMVGTFFIITQFADDNRAGHLTWEQIEVMAAGGMSMEAHTKNHPDLRNREFDFLVFEVVGSLESLNGHTGNTSQMFAYPVGRYDDNTLNFMASTAVQRAVTTQPGTFHTTDNRYEVARMRITNTTGVAGLRGLLNYTDP